MRSCILNIQGMLRTTPSTASANPQARQNSDPSCAQISEVREPAALQLAAAMVRRPVDVPAMGRSVDTAFVGPDSWPTAPAGMQHTPSLSSDTGALASLACGLVPAQFGSMIDMVTNEVHALPSLSPWDAVQARKCRLCGRLGGHSGRAAVSLIRMRLCKHQWPGVRSRMGFTERLSSEQVVLRARRRGGAALPAGALLRQQLPGVPAAVPAAGGAAARLCRRRRRLGCAPPCAVT